MGKSALSHWERASRLTGRITIVSRGIQSALRILVVPASLILLGPEEYGIWLAIGASFSWLMIADGGLIVGSTTDLSTALASGRMRAFKSLVATLLLAFTLALFCLLFLFVTGLYLGVLSNVSSAYSEVIGRSGLVVIAVLFCLGTLSRAADPLANSIKKGYAYQIVGVLSNVSSGLWLVAYSWNSSRISLTHFALISLLPQASVNIAFLLFLLASEPVRLEFPYVQLARKKCLRLLSRSSLPTLLAQLVDLASNSFPALFIAMIDGPGRVPEYVIPLSATLFSSNICSATVGSYWPAISAATAQRRVQWLKDTYRRIALKTLGSYALLTAIAVAFGPFVIREWTGHRILPSRTLLTLLSWQSAAWLFEYINGVFLAAMGKPEDRARLKVIAVCVQIAIVPLLYSSLSYLSIPIGGAIGSSIAGVMGLTALRTKMKDAA